MLTERQQEVFDFIRDFIEDTGFPPTLREMQDYIGVTSPNGILCHLKALEKKGFIAREGHTARAIRIIGEESELQQLRLRVAELEAELAQYRVVS